MQWSHYLLMVGSAALVLGSGLAFQQATLYWAHRIFSMKASAPLGSGEAFLGARQIQNGISPPWHTAYMIFGFMLALAVVVLGFYHIGWVAGLVGIFAGFAASGIVRGFWPPPRSQFYRRHFIKVLRHRAERFAASGDSLRDEAARYFLSALEDITHDNAD